MRLWHGANSKGLSGWVHYSRSATQARSFGCCVMSNIPREGSDLDFVSSLLGPARCHRLSLSLAILRILIHSVLVWLLIVECVGSAKLFVYECPIDGTVDCSILGT